jgi:hypothetical protein
MSGIEQAVADNLIPVVAMVGGMLFTLATFWITHWRHVAIARQQTAFKEQLLAKGLSPDEIVRVVNAGQGKSC